MIIIRLMYKLVRVFVHGFDRTVELSYRTDTRMQIYTKDFSFE